MGGGRKQQATGRSVWRPALGYGAGALLGAAAWVFLVLVAVRVGRSAAEHGEAAAWSLTVVATLGAALCLLLVIVLVWRAVRVVRDRHLPVGGRHR